VLGIHIPQAGDLTGGKRLLQVALEQWPAYLSFAISFIMMTIIWVNHHAMFRYIKKADHLLVLINSLVLMDVVLIPLAAASLGEYLLLNPEDARAAAMIYGGVLAVGGIPYNLIWWYALRTPGLVETKQDREKLKIIGRRYIRGPIFYFIAVGLAYWNVWASMTLYVLLICYFLAPSAGLFYLKKSR